MGLDLYAGTLTRYYSGNWKTVVQQWAEEHGYSFKRVTSAGEEHLEEKIDPEEVCRGMEQWRDFILNALTQAGQKNCTPWPEDNERPYYTDKPDWEAWAALQLYAACRYYGQPLPGTIRKNASFADFPIAKRVAEDEELQWSLFLGAEMWLPMEAPLAFQGPMPTGDSVIISTVGLLRRELEDINQKGWNAGAETIRRWSTEEGYPADAVMPDGRPLTKADIAENTEYGTESLAKYAFSMLWQAVDFSDAHQVPILLDH